jgi:hypothetical protein
MEKFEGLELNGKNVMDIYNQCKKTEKSKETIRAYMFDSISTQIFTPPIDFDKEKITEHHDTILYFLGQLEAVHAGHKVLIPNDGLKRYDHVVWSPHNSLVFTLYYLAVASDCMAVFTKRDNLICTSIANIQATVSPSDPSYKEKMEAFKKNHRD